MSNSLHNLIIRVYVALDSTDISAAFQPHKNYFYQNTNYSWHQHFQASLEVTASSSTRSNHYLKHTAIQILFLSLQQWLCPAQEEECQRRAEDNYQTPTNVMIIVWWHSVQVTDGLMNFFISVIILPAHWSLGSSSMEISAIEEIVNHAMGQGGDLKAKHQATLWANCIFNDNIDILTLHVSFHVKRWFWQRSYFWQSHRSASGRTWQMECRP